MTRLPLLADPNEPKRKGQRFLPYAPQILRASLPLEVVSVVLDDREVGGELVHAEHRRINPHLVEGWNHVRVTFALPDEVESEGVMLPLDDAVRLGAFGERSEVSLRYVLRIRCEKTRIRRSAVIERRGESGRLGTVELLRDDVEGPVTVEALCVLDEDRNPRRVPRGQATDRFSLLARSALFIVQTTTVAPPSGSAFDFAWVDFADPQKGAGYAGEDAAVLRAVPDALSHVVFRDTAPLVLINRRRPECADLLQNKARNRWPARLRDLLLGRIAVDAWRSILSEAADQMREADGGSTELSEELPDLGEDSWVHHVLQHASRSLKMPVVEVVRELLRPESRSRTLFEFSERLGHIGDDVFRKLLDDLKEAD